MSNQIEYIKAVMFKNGPALSGNYKIIYNKELGPIEITIKDSNLNTMILEYMNNYGVCGGLSVSLTKDYSKVIISPSLSFDIEKEVVNDSKTYFCTLSKGSYNDSVIININYIDKDVVNITKEVVVKGLDEEVIRFLILHCNKAYMDNQVSVKLKDGKAVKLFIGTNTYYDVKEVNKKKIETILDVKSIKNLNYRVYIMECTNGERYIVSDKDKVVLKHFCFIVDSNINTNTRFNIVKDGEGNYQTILHHYFDKVTKRSIFNTNVYRIEPGSEVIEASYDKDTKILTTGKGEKFNVDYPEELPIAFNYIKLAEGEGYCLSDVHEDHVFVARLLELNKIEEKEVKLNPNRDEEVDGIAFRSVLKEVENMNNEDDGINTIEGKVEKVCDGVYILRGDKTSILLTNFFQSPRYDNNMSYLIKTKQDVKIEYVGTRDPQAKLLKDAIRMHTSVTVLNNRECYTNKVFVKEGKIYLDNGIESYQIKIGDGTEEAIKMLSKLLPSSNEEVLIFETGEDTLAVYVPNNTLFQVLNYKTKEASANEMKKESQVELYGDVKHVCSGLWEFVDQNQNKYLIGPLDNNVSNTVYDGYVKSYISAGCKIRISYDPDLLENSTLNVVGSKITTGCVELIPGRVSVCEIVYDGDKINLNVHGKKPHEIFPHFMKEDMYKDLSNGPIVAKVYHGKIYDVVVCEKYNYATIISKSALEDYNVIEEVTMICNVREIDHGVSHYILVNEGSKTKYLVDIAGNDMVKHLLSKTDTVKCHCSILNSEISASISTPHATVNNIELIKITGEIATGNIITSDSSNYMFIKDNEKGHYLLQHNENPNRYYKTDLVEDKQVVTLITVTKKGEERLVLIDNGEIFTYLKAKLYKPNFMKGDIISLAPGKFKDMKTGDEYFVRNKALKPMMISNIVGSHFVVYQLVNKDTYFLTHPKLSYGMEVELHKVPTFDATMVCKTPDTNLIANIRKDLNELLFKLLNITDLDKVNMILDKHNELLKCSTYFNANKAIGGFNNYNPYSSGECTVGKTSDGMKEDKNLDFSSSWHVTDFNPYLDGVAYSGLKFDSPSGIVVRPGDVVVPKHDSYCGNYSEMPSEQLIKTGSEIINDVTQGGYTYVEGTLNHDLRNQAAMDKGHSGLRFDSDKTASISNISKELMEALNSKKSLVPLIPKREVKTKGYIHVDMDNEGIYKINEVSLVQPYAEHSHIGEPLFALDMSQVEPHNVNSSFPNMYSILITTVKEKTNRVDFEDSDLIFSLNAVNALVKFDFKFNPIIKERHFVSNGISRGRLQPSRSVITYPNPKAFKKLSVPQPGDIEYEVYKAFLDRSKVTTIYKLFGDAIKEILDSKH